MEALGEAGTAAMALVISCNYGLVTCRLNPAQHLPSVPSRSWMVIENSHSYCERQTGETGQGQIVETVICASDAQRERSVTILSASSSFIIATVLVHNRSIGLVEDVKGRNDSSDLKNCRYG